MLSKTKSLTHLGIEAFPVEVEIDISRGLPGISIVGLPDQAVKESKDRIKPAIRNSGFDFPAL
ncbi:MAG: magnesium chelatase, partial [Candidatus Omnitrophica bacterium]|nr:magnesium chelatase [Candidatus Omnitrophota bacterium]